VTLERITSKIMFLGHPMAIIDVPIDIRVLVPVFIERKVQSA